MIIIGQRKVKSKYKVNNKKSNIDINDIDFNNKIKKYGCK